MTVYLIATLTLVTWLRWQASRSIVQWGMGGLFNFGLFGFYMLGAYIAGFADGAGAAASIALGMAMLGVAALRAQSSALISARLSEDCSRYRDAWFC